MFSYCMSWFGGSESTCTITCVPFIPSRLVISLISKPQVRWLSHASREILEQRDFPGKKGEEGGTLSKHLLCSRSLSPRNLRGWPSLSHFTDEETEVRDAGANSWQSWELNTAPSGCKALLTKMYCFSAKQLSTWLLSRCPVNVPSDSLTKIHTQWGQQPSQVMKVKNQLEQPLCFCEDLVSDHC